MEFWDNGRSSSLFFFLTGCGLLGNVMWVGMGMGMVMGFARYALCLDGIE